MNLKVKAFIEKQKERRKILKEIDRIYNRQVWDEYNYQGQENGTQEELNKISKGYDEQIIILREKLKTL